MNTLVTSIHNDIIPPERLNCPYYYQPHDISLHAIEETKKEILRMKEWQEEREAGKMFGVLVVRKEDGGIGFLKAYSGQICSRQDWEGWVPPVFDYLHPNGYFLFHEQEISALNTEILRHEQSPQFLIDCQRLSKLEETCKQEQLAFREEMTRRKALRKQIRETITQERLSNTSHSNTSHSTLTHSNTTLSNPPFSNTALSNETLLNDSASTEQEASLIRESQFLKAELKRMKKHHEELLAPLQQRVNNHHRTIALLRQQRKQKSDALQTWLFEHFVVRNGKGETRNLCEIFRKTPAGVPPSGAGECCAPKLLQYAFTHNLQPLAIAEFWWGKSPIGEIRNHGECYPACQGKCRPILDFMLEGVDVEPNALYEDQEVKTLHVLYEDNFLVAIEKPAGMLSVPGKGRCLSAQELLTQQLGSGMLFCVHRLDMQTSGILLFAKSIEIQRAMHRAFALREVKKNYLAVLDGIPERFNAVLKGNLKQFGIVNTSDEGILPQRETAIGKSGVISLPLSPDFLNRPMQKVDHEGGKEATTLYKVLDIENHRTRLLLTPLTGRTHQLRVHCAHCEGLGQPIVGDNLYGHHSNRLLLHATRVEFSHPATGEKVIIESSCPF